MEISIEYNTSNWWFKISQTPISNANRTIWKAYDWLVKVNEKARVYILANMSDVLAKKHESLAMTKEIWLMLPLKATHDTVAYAKILFSSTSVMNFSIKVKRIFQPPNLGGIVVSFAAKNVT